MNGAGDHLFSGSRFAFDQDSRIDGRDFHHRAKDRLKAGADADDFIETVA